MKNRFWKKNCIVILNNFFKKQFGQKIHYRGHFSHLLSMLWTNHQNDVILGSKLRYMSKCGQSVKKNRPKKVFFVILNNSFNRQFDQKIHYRRQFSHLLSMLWKKSSKWRNFGAKMTIYVDETVWRPMTFYQRKRHWPISFWNQRACHQPKYKSLK